MVVPMQERQRFLSGNDESCIEEFRNLLSQKRGDDRTCNSLRNMAMPLPWTTQTRRPRMLVCRLQTNDLPPHTPVQFQ